MASPPAANEVENPELYYPRIPPPPLLQSTPRRTMTYPRSPRRGIELFAPLPPAPPAPTVTFTLAPRTRSNTPMATAPTASACCRFRRAATHTATTATTCTDHDHAMWPRYGWRKCITPAPTNSIFLLNTNGVSSGAAGVFEAKP